MEKKNIMLCAWKFDESHTAANISAAILSHVHSWEIEKKTFCIIRDNAGNMIAGMFFANLKSLSYFAHSLQLIIKGGVSTQQAGQQLLSIARSLVGCYH